MTITSKPLGIALPHIGAHAGPEPIMAVAKAAEARGFASLWTLERILRPVAPVAKLMGGDPTPITLPVAYGSVYDPLETLAFVSAVTTKIKLGTSTLDTLFHVPVTLARRMATVDLLSGGRLVAGLGQGWVKEEFETAGIPMSRRGAGFEEHLEVMRAVWRPDPVHFEGRYYTVAESNIGPKPARPEGPALLVGAMAPAAIERGARLGLGFNPVTVSWQQLEADIRRFREFAEQHGRDPQSLPVYARGNAYVTDEPAGVDRLPFRGNLEQIGDDIEHAAACGADEVFVDVNNSEHAVDVHMALIDRFGSPEGE